GYRDPRGDRAEQPPGHRVLRDRPGLQGDDLGVAHGRDRHHAPGQPGPHAQPQVYPRHRGISFPPFPVTGSEAPRRYRRLPRRYALVASWFPATGPGTTPARTRTGPAGPALEARG